MDNSVQALKAITFARLTLDQKIELKSLGRPTPEFCMMQTENKKSENRVFRRQLLSKDAYQKNDWICGCDVQKSLFCFPCILFSLRDSGDCLWTVKGVNDVKHLTEKIKKHEISVNHMNSVVDLSLLGKVNILSSLDSQYRLNIEKQNIQVSKNRHILKRLISCVKFCSVFELPLRGHDESASSTNPGVYKGLINFTAELDSAMKDHLELATVFKGTSKIIQNDILDGMPSVCKEEIEKNI